MRRTTDRQLRDKVSIQDRSQRAARRFLQNILEDDRGVGVLFGPEASGKSGVIEQFVQGLETKLSIADVGGAGLQAPELLSAILDQFGYRVELTTVDELVNMLRVIVVQQARTRQAPVLIVREFNSMYPSAFSALCQLATQKIYDHHALRMIFVSDRFFRRIFESPNMGPIADRLIGSFEMRPYLKLPKLILTFGGEVVQEAELLDSRVMIGRSKFSDILLSDQGVSRQHAMLVKHEDVIVLFDLRSRNGTFVNGNPVSSIVLRDNDIITIGNHRLKVYYPSDYSGAIAEETDLADTTKMKSLVDVFRSRKKASEGKVTPAESG